MNVTDQLKEIVDGVARAGALTPEAIRQFDEMRQRVEGLEGAIAAKSNDLSDTRKALSSTEGKLESANKENAALKARVAELEKQERAAEKAVWVADFEKQRREEMRSIVSDVFRNAEVRRTISHSNPVVVPPSYPGGCHSTQYMTDTREETETVK